MYLDRHHEKMKMEIADSESQLNEVKVDLFSNFKGLSERDIARINA